MARQRQIDQFDKLPPQPEASFQRQVLDLARLMGFRAYHTWNSLHSAAGFPDLVLVRRPRVIFVELKSERGKVGDDQWAWLDDLKRCPGVEVHLWRPSDWPEIEKVLSR
jgi:hypothetical protein